MAINLINTVFDANVVNPVMWAHKKNPNQKWLGF